MHWFLLASYLLVVVSPSIIFPVFWRGRWTKRRALFKGFLLFSVAVGLFAVGALWREGVPTIFSTPISSIPREKWDRIVENSLAVMAIGFAWYGIAFLLRIGALLLSFFVRKLDTRYFLAATVYSMLIAVSLMFNGDHSGFVPVPDLGVFDPKSRLILVSKD